jgi:hypothetical protein
MQDLGPPGSGVLGIPISLWRLESGELWRNPEHISMKSRPWLRRGNWTYVFCLGDFRLERTSTHGMGLGLKLSHESVLVKPVGSKDMTKIAVQDWIPSTPMTSSKFSPRPGLRSAVSFPIPFPRLSSVSCAFRALRSRNHASQH